MVRQSHAEWLEGGTSRRLALSGKYGSYVQIEAAHLGRFIKNYRMVKY